MSDFFPPWVEQAGIPWEQRACSELITKRWGSSGDRLLKWLVLHVMLQSDVGHVCCDLRAVEREFFQLCELSEEQLSIAEVTARQLGSSWRHLVQQNPLLFAPPHNSHSSPFVLDEQESHYVYLVKNYRAERTLLSLLKQRLSAVSPLTSIALQKPLRPELKKILQIVETGGLSLITGGPGTGKTSLIRELLPLLTRHSGEAPTLFLAAPTGRAAQRLSESLGTTENFPIPEATTIHKLLASWRSKHTETGTIRADLVVIDEASMVSLNMMNKLLIALSPQTHLMLVGDPHQLPAIEQGTLLADLLSEVASPGHLLHRRLLALEKVFRSSLAILEVAQTILRGDLPGLAPLLKKHKEGKQNLGVFWSPLPSPEKVAEAILERFPPFPDHPNSSDLSKRLDFFKQYMALSPLRRGPYGVHNLNRLIEEKFTPLFGHFYHGQPIIILKNLPSCGLYNGDRGVIFFQEKTLYAIFPPQKKEKSGRILPLSQLKGAFESAYISTIHKSQGSECRELLLLVPPTSGLLCSRELLYTGLTRAKECVWLWGEKKTLLQAASSPLTRRSLIDRELLKSSSPAGD